MTDQAAYAKHQWIGRPTGDGDGDWRCQRCPSVCDHETPCGRHGKCRAPKPTLIERVFSRA